MTNIGRGMWFGLCLLFFGVTLTGQQRDLSKELPPQSFNWDLEVLRFESSAPTILWVGLVNKSGEARLVCITTQGFSYEQKDDIIRGSGGGAPFHGCMRRAQFQFVKAGQAFFVPMITPADLSSRAKSPLHVYVFAHEWAPLEKAPFSKRVEASWHGTVKEANDRGRALATKSTQ